VKRRAWSVWALGTAGLACGATGMAWPRLARAQPALPAAGTDAAAFWQGRYDRPDGQPLDLAAFRGKPLVLNFWGTWCAPCIKEMPELDRFHREFAPRGWQVLGLAVDKPKAVREFLLRQPVGYAIALAGFEGSGLARELGNTQGALPFTAVLDRQGRIARRRLGQTSFDELAGWARAI
jgi:thiol-disulfide isomerase/thioredoxin